jgi:hypothetical protein
MIDTIARFPRRCQDHFRPHDRNPDLCSAGDAVFATALFGTLALAERAFPVLRERPALAAA